MRGAPSRRGACVCRSGIIPAYAGSTLPLCRGAPSGGDHPRVCGEHDASHARLAAQLGSSPRMRGAQDAIQRDGPRDGIIPAYAGSTAASGQTVACFRDHPRVCGEHHARRSVPDILKGSSPRMRGALHMPASILEGNGIIPAYAGSTSTSLTAERCPRDHPRVCGEHPRPDWGRVLLSGSSPRMRGARCR